MTVDGCNPCLREVLPDKKIRPALGFFTRAATAIAGNGSRLCEVRTDNAFAYRSYGDFLEALGDLGA
ncbi:hypothetical protein [Arthrobacter sp. 8AJ]|uniref:hypothetical protein n=1 Tax=Arthrobacter sp. 8AJ TaxID=2653130 RepID=UPI0012F11EE6|nr:hypothetical protein [Arthrobacter sp. 8AJ]VXC55881.1 hypothetical protein ARTHRO8AJ_90047 [Arthrobacter sp. 8AJ]